MNTSYCCSTLLLILTALSSTRARPNNYDSGEPHPEVVAHDENGHLSANGSIGAGMGGEMQVQGEGHVGGDRAGMAGMPPAPPFLGELNEANRTAFMKLYMDMNLTKGQIVSNVQNWLQSLPQSVQEAYMGWQSNMTQTRNNAMETMKGKLSAESSKVLDELQGILEDQSTTFPETCTKLVQAFNSTPQSVIDDIEKVTLETGHGPQNINLRPDPAQRPQAGMSDTLPGVSMPAGVGAISPVSIPPGMPGVMGTPALPGTPASIPAGLPGTPAVPPMPGTPAMADVPAALGVSIPDITAVSPLPADAVSAALPMPMGMPAGADQKNGTATWTAQKIAENLERLCHTVVVGDPSGSHLNALAMGGIKSSQT